MARVCCLLCAGGVGRVTWRRLNPQLSIDSIRSQAMAVDKKVSDGELRLILLKGELGGCVMTGDYDDAAMRATIQDFCDRQ